MLIKIGYSLLVMLVAYCCGNFNGAIITSRTQYNSDVREMGSGNAGLTNFYRCYGAAKLFLVAAIDMGKALPEAVRKIIVSTDSTDFTDGGRGKIVNREN